MLLIVQKILEKHMYNRLYTFPSNNGVIYISQFGFRQYYLSHALINTIENIRKAIDDRNIGPGVFLDIQKELDAVDY